MFPVVVLTVLKVILRARILDSVVFRRDMEVGRQDGHQLQTEQFLRK